MFGWNVISSRSIYEKTNYIIFKSRQKKLNYNFPFLFGNQSLNQANLTKFLGVYVDEHLTWKHHISFIFYAIFQVSGYHIQVPILFILKN